MQLKLTTPFTSSSRAIAGSLIVLCTNLHGAPPAPLTAAQLKEFDKQAMPMQPQIEKAQKDAQLILDADAKRSNETNKFMHPFLKQYELGALLVQAQPAAPTPPAEAVVPKKPNPKVAKAPKVTTLKVECDGGLYFDSDNGVLAYLKNVRLTEPRFKLTCSDELKVFLDKKPVTSAKPTDKKPTDSAATKEGAKKEPKEEPTAKVTTKKKESTLSSFGDLKRIVASGNVKVVQKDEKGNLFIASAQTASYDAKTGEMILKGGLPRLQQSENQYLQAREPGAWIRIHKNGKLITSKSKWVMQTTTK